MPRRYVQRSSGGQFVVKLGCQSDARSGRKPLGIRHPKGTNNTMSTSSTTKRVGLGLIAATLAAGLTMGSGTSSVKADPTQLDAYVGMGSDTTQDVINAMSGFNYGLDYNAINSGSATGYKHIISFNAAPAQTAGDNCITPVLNGPTFTRPNGSGAGRKALYQATSGVGLGWTGASFTLDNSTVLPTCATLVNISGAVNFARSSSVGTTTGTDEVYVPFGRDAVTYISYRPGGGAALATLTRKNLIDAYASATRVTVADPDGTGTVTIVPCGVQTSSGTMSFFKTIVTLASTGSEQAAVALCTPAEVNRLQESKGDQLKAKGDAFYAGTLGAGAYTADTQLVVIAPMSAAGYIAQANGVSDPNGYTNVTLGGISDDGTTGTGGADLGSPTTGTAPNLAPNLTFYASAGVGRDVYNVFKRSSIINTGTGFTLTNGLVALFLDTNVAANGTAGAPNNTSANNSSKLCQNSTVIEKFGFGQISNCGDYSLTKAWGSDAASA